MPKRKHQTPPQQHLSWDNLSTENLTPSQRYQRLKASRLKDSCSSFGTSENLKNHPSQSGVRKLSIQSESFSQSDEKQNADLCGCFSWCSTKNKRKLNKNEDKSKLM